MKAVQIDLLDHSAVSYHSNYKKTKLSVKLKLKRKNEAAFNLICLGQVSGK